MWTRLTCHFELPRTARLSPPMASIPVAFNTASGWSGSRPWSTGCSARVASAPELLEAGVGDPEVVRNLVVDRLGDGGRQGVRARVGTHQRPTEDGDLARCRRGIR